MAYTREDAEKIEVSYPLDAIWQAIPKAVAQLEWAIEEADEARHHFKIKTKGAFLSYGSTMQVDLTAINGKTTKMSISAETPVTTITSMADYGRTHERIDVLIGTLAKLMEAK